MPLEHTCIYISSLLTNAGVVITFWEDDTQLQDRHQVVDITVDALCYSRVLEGAQGQISAVRDTIRAKRVCSSVYTWIFMAISLPSFKIP